MSHTVNPTTWRRFNTATEVYMMNRDKLNEARRSTLTRGTGKGADANQYSTRDRNLASAYSIAYSAAHEGHILTYQNTILFSHSDRTQVVEEYQRRMKIDIQLHIQKATTST